MIVQPQMMGLTFGIWVTRVCVCVCVIVCSFSKPEVSRHTQEICKGQGRPWRLKYPILESTDGDRIAQSNKATPLTCKTQTPSAADISAN
jgi:hypothetical protein